MADHIEDALIREVNDDLREEQMKLLWKRYGGYVVGAAILVVAIVAGYQGWKQYTTSTRLEEGERFYAASQLADTGNVAGAMAAFASLAGDASTGYGVLATFQQATLKADAGDTAGAAALYAQIAQETISDPAISGLAQVLGTALEINAGGYDRGALELRLKAIAEDGQPYRYSAREMLALLAMQAGDVVAARTQFEQLASDATAPQGIAQRAGEIAQSLGATQVLGAK